MKPAVALVLFAAAAALQLGVPASMVATREIALRRGEALKFRTGTVDPYDAFRGRYVTLRCETWLVPEPQGLRKGQWMYVSFTNDAGGVARAVAASLQPPAAGPYLRLRAPQPWNDRVEVKLPFDRYYAEEHRAPKVEAAYRQAANRKNQDAYAVVRVYRGRGVLEDLLVGGRSAREIAK